MNQIGELDRGRVGERCDGMMEVRRAEPHPGRPGHAIKINTDRSTVVVRGSTPPEKRVFLRLDDDPIHIVECQTRDLMRSVDEPGRGNFRRSGPRGRRQQEKQEAPAEDRACKYNPSMVANPGRKTPVI